MSARRAPGLVGLAWRQVRSDVVVSLTLALTVLLTATLLAAWPRDVANVDRQQAQHVVGQTSAKQRDVVAVTSSDAQAGKADTAAGTTFQKKRDTTFPKDAAEAAWGERYKSLEKIRQQQPEPLRSSLGDARSVHSTAPQPMGPADPDLGRMQIILGLDARLDREVELVDGTWPAASSVPEGPQGDTMVPVVISTGTAESTGFKVGDVWKGPTLQLRIDGIVKAKDEKDGYWQHVPYGLDTATTDDLNFGLSSIAWAWTSPAGQAQLGTRAMDTRVWFPLTLGDDADQLSTLSSQVRGMSSRTIQVTSGGAQQPLQFEAEVGAVLDTLASATHARHAFQSTVVAGPVTAAGIVLVLACALIASRRRPATHLLAARGASALQLRGPAVVEGLLIGLPAAALGVLIGRTLIAADGGLLGWVLPLLVGLTPAVALGLLTHPGAPGSDRSGPSPAMARARLVAEALVILAALAAVTLVLISGREDAATGEAGVDPLLVAAPTLCVVVLTVVAVRIYPRVLGGVATLARRRPSLVSWLGVVRSLRDPSLGVLPVLALVVSVSVSAFATVTWDSVEQATARKAWTQVGADLRVTGMRFAPEDAEAMAKTEGVDKVALAGTGSSERVAIDGESSRRNTRPLAIDSEALADIQAGTPADRGLPAMHTVKSNRSIPVVVPKDSPFPDHFTLVKKGGIPLEVVARVDALPGVPWNSDTIVVDRALWKKEVGSTVAPTSAMVSIDSGADPATVSEALKEGRPNAIVADPRAATDAVRSTPAATGMARQLTLSVTVGALLSVAAVCVGQLLSMRSRKRTLDVLAALGLPRKGASALAAWDVVPAAVVAAVVGVTSGVLLPILLLHAVDLGALSGGEQPTLAPLLGLVVSLAVLALVVVVTAAVSAWTARRLNPAQALRHIDEE